MATSGDFGLEGGTSSGGHADALRGTAANSNCNLSPPHTPKLLCSTHSVTHSELHPLMTPAQTA
eukprot:scaffold35176_cov53-Phaeocystis_antarctica.AAC.2